MIIPQISSSYLLLFLALLVTTVRSSVTPTASSNVATNYPSTGAFTITILGGSLGTSDQTCRARSGGTVIYQFSGRGTRRSDTYSGLQVAEATTWVSVSSVLSKAALSDQFLAKAIVLTHADTALAKATLLNALSSEAVSVSSLLPSNAPVTGSWFITVLSKSGGSGSIWARLGGTVIGETDWISATALILKTCSGWALSAESTVTSEKSMLAHSLTLTATFDMLPRHSSLVRANIASSGATYLTIFGRNIAASNSRTGRARASGTG